MAAQIQVNQEFIDILAEAIAKANLRAAGLLPLTSTHPPAESASNPLHGGSETASQGDPWATEANPTSGVPATTTTSPTAPDASSADADPFSQTKRESLDPDPWAPDGLGDLIRRASDISILTELWRANKSTWNDDHTKLADVRKKELNK